MKGISLNVSCQTEPANIEVGMPEPLFLTCA